VVKTASGMVSELEELDRFRKEVENRLTEAERIKNKVEYKLIALYERKDKISRSLSDVEDDIDVSMQTSDANLTTNPAFVTVQAFERTLAQLKDEQSRLESEHINGQTELASLRERLTDVKQSVATNVSVASDLRAEVAGREEEAEAARAVAAEEERKAIEEVNLHLI
jgi:chromosome segregation ATPase